MKNLNLYYIGVLIVLFTYMILNLVVHPLVLMGMIFSYCFYERRVPFHKEISEDDGRIINSLYTVVLLGLFWWATDWLIVFLCIVPIYHILDEYVSKTTSAFKSMSIIGTCLIIFSSVSIRQFEIVSESNIKNGFDAIWWSICTITTVGYGDKFPVTDSGKIIALILMVCGIGLFGTLIGYVSTFFVDRENSNNDKVDTIEELSLQIKEMQTSIELIIKNNK